MLNPVLWKNLALFNVLLTKARDSYNSCGLFGEIEIFRYEVTTYA